MSSWPFALPITESVQSEDAISSQNKNSTAEIWIIIVLAIILILLIATIIILYSNRTSNNIYINDRDRYELISPDKIASRGARF